MRVQVITGACRVAYSCGLFRLGKIVKSFVFALLFIGSVMPVHALDLREQVHARLLLSGYPDQVRLGAKGLEKSGGPSQDIIDVVAEVLLLSVKDGSSLDIDTQSWLARAIGASGSQRYRVVLKAVEQALDDRKFSRYADHAREQMRTAGAAFVSEPSRLESLSAQLAQPVQPMCDLSRFSELEVGAGLDGVLSVCGMPNQVGSAETDTGHVARTGWGGVRIRGQILTLGYEQIGSVSFVHEGGDWFLAQRYPEAHADGRPYTAVDRDRDDLLNFNGASLLAAARAMVRRKAHDIETLEAAARGISKYFTERRNPARIQGVAHLCRLLRESGNPRYRDLRSFVKRNAGHSSPRRHCGKELDQLDVAGVKQFSLPTR